MTTVSISRMILRRGDAWELPGKPIVYVYNDPRLDTGSHATDDEFDSGFDIFWVSSAGPSVLWTKPLDEGEMAFVNDQGRLFIGADPTENLKNSKRISFPYQNIEVVNENSIEAFSSLHGELLQDSNVGFYSAPLYPTGGNQYPVLQNGNSDTPYEISLDGVAMLFVYYAVNDQQGIAVRQGCLHVEYNNGEIFVEDEADTSRAAELDSDFSPEYDSNNAFGQLRFSFGTNGGKLSMLYINLTLTTYSMMWRISRVF